MIQMKGICFVSQTIRYQQKTQKHKNTNKTKTNNNMTTTINKHTQTNKQTNKHAIAEDPGLQDCILQLWYLL